MFTPQFIYYLSRKMVHPESSYIKEPVLAKNYKIDLFCGIILKFSTLKLFSNAEIFFNEAETDVLKMHFSAVERSEMWF